MKRIIMLSTLAATMAVMLALAGSAFAANPERATFHAEGTDFIADCGDFDVLTDFVADFDEITYLDSAGKPDYSRVHFAFNDFFYNSETGEGFAETNTGTTVSDASGAELTSSGLSYHVTVPGEGVVLLQAGRLEFDEDGNVVFVAGPHQVLRRETQKLCEALAGS